jgi:hypothetical protein
MKTKRGESKMADSEFLMNKQLLKKIEDKERSQKMSP